MNKNPLTKNLPDGMLTYKDDESPQFNDERGTEMVISKESKFFLMQKIPSFLSTLATFDKRHS